MVSRILRYEAEVGADETDITLDSKSPGAGKMWEVREVYQGSGSGHRFSLSYEERKLFDNIPGDDLADRNNGLPFDLTVGENQDLSILASDENGSADTATFYVVVDESGGDN